MYLTSKISSNNSYVTEKKFSRSIGLSPFYVDKCVKKKCRTFLRIVLKCFHRIQITSTWRIWIETGSRCKTNCLKSQNKQPNKQFVTLFLQKHKSVWRKVIVWNRIFHCLTYLFPSSLTFSIFVGVLLTFW